MPQNISLFSLLFPLITLKITIIIRVIIIIIIRRKILHFQRFQILMIPAKIQTRILRSDSNRWVTWRTVRGRWEVAGYTRDTRPSADDTTYWTSTTCCCSHTGYYALILSHRVSSERDGRMCSWTSFRTLTACNMPSSSYSAVTLVTLVTRVALVTLVTLVTRVLPQQKDKRVWCVLGSVIYI